MSKVCVATTYKNNYNLFNAFFNFYNDIWKVEKFILFCGISPCGNTEEEIIKIMENKTEKFINKIQITDSNKYVYNVRLLQNSKISLFLYDTQDVYEQNIEGTYGTGKIFDGIIRPFLFKLSNYLNNIFNYCEYYLSVDQDDFLYIPPLNFNNIFKNSKNDIWFKTLEYIPNKNFNSKELMNFADIGYYFHILSENNNTIPYQIKSFNKHGWTGNYHNPFDYYQRKINISKRNTFFDTLNGTARCGHWEKKIDITTNLREHNIAFCFGCLDLPYLLNNRNFFKSKANSPDAKEVSILDKTEHFYKYYHRLDLIKYRSDLLLKYFYDTNKKQEYVYFFCVNGKNINKLNNDKIDIESKSYYLVNSFRNHYQEKLYALIPSFFKNTQYDVSIETKQFYIKNNVEIIYFNHDLLNEETLFKEKKRLLLANKCYAFKKMCQLFSSIKIIFFDTDLILTRKIPITADMMSSDFCGVLSDTIVGYNEILIKTFNLSITNNIFFTLKEKIEMKFAYFNSGFFITNSDIDIAECWCSTFEQLFTIYNIKNIYPIEEQTALSVALNIKKKKVFILDRNYNYSYQILKTKNEAVIIYHYHNENPNKLV